MNPIPGVLRETRHFLHPMDIAIVTGAETPLGLRIIEGLIQQGCRVHGIGNNLSNLTYADRNFIAHAIDVSDLAAVQKTTSEILEQEGRLHILIHAIDVTPGAAFENLPVGNLEAILKIGLLGPVMLTRMALPNLLRYRGQLINVIPANKSGHTASAVNALIEGGLREMNGALFDHARDAGLKVTNLILRQNTELPAATVSDEQLDQTRIDLEQVARTIDYLLNANESNVPNEISLHPRLSPDASQALPEAPLPVDPYNAIILPPAEYCPPEEPKILTKQADNIERTIPYTDEEMEEKIAAAIEDYEEHPERYEAKEKKPRKQKQSKQTKQDAPQQQDLQDKEGKSKRRRGRRRGGRDRNRNHDSQEPQSQQPRTQGESNKHEAPQAPEKTKNTAAVASPAEQEQFINKKPTNRRRRGPRKPAQAAKPEKQQADTIAEPKAETKPKPKAKIETKTTSKTTEAKPVKKKATKKAAKKAAKKAVKKTAVKKTPAKKAAKKATKKAAKKKAVKKAE